MSARALGADKYGRRRWVRGNKGIEIMLPDDMRAQLDAECDALGKNRSELVREILAAHFAAQKKDATGP